MVNIGACLSLAGYNDLCCDLIIQADLLNKVMDNEILLMHLLPNLFHSSYFIYVLSQVTNYIKQKEGQNTLVLTIIHILLLSDRERYNKEELLSIERLLLSEVEWTEYEDANFLKGVSYYNLANYYREIFEFNLAIKNYVQAKRYHERYKFEAYYYHDLASIFFDIGKYRWASLAYQKTIDLEGELIAKALLGDALMFQGYYEKARMAFDHYLSESKENNDYEWHLKLICLSTFIDHGWAKIQKRDTKTAKKLVEKGRYEEALEKDFLLDIAWYNIGIIHNESSRYLESTMSFLMAALLSPQNIEAWVDATGCCLSGKFESSKDLLYYIVNCAYVYNNEAYIRELLTNSNFEDLSLNNYIEKIIDEIIVKSDHNINRNKIIRSFNGSSWDEAPYFM